MKLWFVSQILGFDSGCRFLVIGVSVGLEWGLELGYPTNPRENRQCHAT